jgi:alkylation response protein AidB-like acyl-CoA dehydrogenase
VWSLLFVSFYLGTAEGALAEANEYVHAKAKPWQTSGVAQASEDPYLLELYGSLYSDVCASVALAEAAATEIEAAIQRGSERRRRLPFMRRRSTAPRSTGGDLTDFRSHGGASNIGALRLRSRLA